MFSICNLSQFKASQHVCDMPSKTNIILHLFLYLFVPSLISWYTSPHTHSLTLALITHSRRQLHFVFAAWFGIAIV